MPIKSNTAKKKVMKPRGKAVGGGGRRVGKK